MRKELVKEVNFGRAVARITVTGYLKENMMDGWIKTGEELIIYEKIEIVADGKVVESSSYAKEIECNFLYENLFEKMGLDKNKKYSKVGEAITEGENVAKEINEAIKEMKEQITAEFGMKTKEQIEEGIEKEEEIAEAKEIVKKAEKIGIENLMTKEEYKRWVKSYNNIMNEGGEGYIPQRVTKEDYKWAINKLKEMK